MALPAETYARAERFLEWRVRQQTRNVAIAPHWLPGSDRFWYEREEQDSKRIILVDPARGVAEVVDAPPRDTAAPSPPAPGRLRAPDGSRDLLVRDGNLFVAPAGSDDATALTYDGAPDHDYAGSPDTTTTAVTTRRSGIPQPPVALWSPDSRKVLTHRLDQRQVGALHLVQAVPPDGGLRPVLYSYHSPLVGDEHLPSAELGVIDVEQGTLTPIQDAELLVEFLSPIEMGWVWWSEDAASVYFLREARGAKGLRLCVADARTGTVQTVLEETSDAYVEVSSLLPWPCFVRTIPTSGEIVWLSERDGWWHLYLFDGASGALVRQLTHGAWLVREVLHVDEGGWIYFVACGREPGRDPYLRHLYRVALDGREPELLTPEDADHGLTFSPSKQYFVDTSSTVDTAPVTRLRRADGTLVLVLETADLGELLAAGWKPPERFQVKARDGATDLYGLLYFPTDFDPARSYPVIDHVYPGPQLIRTPKGFAADSSVIPYNWPGMWGAQALAELGFVVMNLDGPGTPLRSRAFHLASYGKLEDGSGLADHVAALQQLAATRPYLDLSRVGINGHSAGGYVAARGILAYPEFFRVAVAASGVHDLRRYLAYWGEKYQGLLGQADYTHQANATLAHRLEGKLLLMHGELDDNVHPSVTLALVDALIKANKDFDLVILPNESHTCFDHPYYIRRTWDYFVRHLLGVEPPVGYRIADPS